MIDAHKQTEYWREGAAEEREMAADLFARGRRRHALFFLHLSLEKIIKAHVCRAINDLAPREHNLVRLVQKAELSISEGDAAFLAEMTRFNIEGRYPDSYEQLPSDQAIDRIRSESERLYQWLLDQL